MLTFWCATCAEPADEAHYAPWSPCESGITPGHIRNILTHGDGRPQTGWSVTQIKGCLRSVIIERTMDVVVDPAAYLLMELGTAWDAHVTRHEEAKPRWRGALGGLKISGEPDGHNIELIGRDDEPVTWHSNGELPIIWDYKNGTPPRAGVWPDHRWQVSVYAMLSPYAFDHGYIYYNSYGGKAGKVCKRRFELIRDENALLDHEIYKGYTVRDNIKLAIGHKGSNARAAAYPLTGQSISMGKKTLCDYCTVRDACEELEGGGVGI